MDNRDKIKEFQKEWKLITQKISILKEQNIIETREDECFRLEKIIEKAENKRREIEQKILQLESQVSKTDISILRGERHKLYHKNICISLFLIVVMLLLYFLMQEGEEYGKYVNELLVEADAFIGSFDAEGHQEVTEGLLYLIDKFTKVPDSEISKTHRFIKYKYKAELFRIASLLETNTQKVQSYIGNGIEAGDSSLRIIEEIREEATNVGSRKEKIYKLIREFQEKEQVKHILIGLYILRLRKIPERIDRSVTSQKIEKLFREVPGSYRNKPEFKKDENIIWYLKQKEKIVAD